VQARAIILFENSIKSEATKHVYLFYLKKFVQFYKLKSIESILDIPDNQLQVMLEDYLFDLKKKVSPNSLNTPFAALELFCIINDKIGINFKKIRKMFPARLKVGGKKAWPTEDIQHMLEATKEIRTKALIHFVASTGCRIGAIKDLKISNIMDMPHGCMAAQIYEGYNEEYWTFLTPEASDHLKNYLKKREDDGEHLDKNHPLFREKYTIGSAKPKFLKNISVKAFLRRAIDNSIIQREKNGIRYDVMTNHGFRKRFNTILKLNKDISPAVTEKLLGHKINLDGVYFTPTREDLFNEFVKAVEDLTIDNSARLLARTQKLETEKSELEKREREIDDLKENMDKIIEEKIGEYNQKFMKNLEKMYDEQILASEKRLDAMDRAFEKKLDEIDRN